MKKIDYFIKVKISSPIQLIRVFFFDQCYVAFLIDVFQPSKSVFGTNSGSILVQVQPFKFRDGLNSFFSQEFNLSDVHLLCVRMFIKRLHLFCSYQIGIAGNNTPLANTGMNLLEQRNLLVPLQTLKRFVLRSISKNSE